MTTQIQPDEKWVTTRNARPSAQPAEKPATPANTQDSVQSLLEKNLKWSQLIYEQNEKIKRTLTWMVVGNYVRLSLILIPLIAGILFLPPLVKNMMQQYESVLGGQGNQSVISEFRSLLTE